MPVVQIPSSLDAATKRLKGIDALLTAKGWERAAIVYAFTEAVVGSNQHGGSREIVRLPVKQFAALGLAGLTTQDTVRTYRTLWAEHGDPDIGPGSKVTIPEIDFPPQDRNLGSRMPADPEKAIAVLVEKHGEAAVADAVVAQPRLVTEVVQKAAKRPGAVPVKPTTPPAEDMYGDLWRAVHDLQGLVARFSSEGMDAEVQRAVADALRNMLAFVDPASVELLR